MTVRSTTFGPARTFYSLYAYVGREFLFSFLVSFLFFFFIFFINQLLLLAEDILSKHVAFPDVALLVIYSLPAIVAISFPFASLVGSLMAVGRLSSDNEILAFQASGISTFRVFVPIVVLSLAFSLFSFVMNDYFLPLGTINFGKLYTKVLYTNPQLALDPFSIKRYQDATIVTGAVDQNRISDIVIFDTTAQKDKRIITAQSAVLSHNAEQTGAVSLDLTGVFSETDDVKKTNQFTYSTAKRMVYNILLSDVNTSLRAPTAREMSSIDVYRQIRQKEAILQDNRRAQAARAAYAAFALEDLYREAVTENSAGPLGPSTNQELHRLLNDYNNVAHTQVQDRSLRIDRIEFNRKFSVPFACLFFVIFSFPVGLL
ncbi:MAG TPA: LptF/LptG family permease, partial [Spirochaetia bacterium]|nr:LptF/LptG family permease [Spirochaetia bacterium]